MMGPKGSAEYADPADMSRFLGTESVGSPWSIHLDDKTNKQELKGVIIGAAGGASDQPYTDYLRCESPDGGDVAQSGGAS